MTRGNIDEFVRRARAVTDASPPAAAEETRSWLVDQLLEVLGWDVRTPGRRVDVTVAGTRLEYVLSAASTPALFVAVEPYTDPLERERADRIRSAMNLTGVDRAIYTNGRQFALLAGVDDLDDTECTLGSLPDHEGALVEFSRATARRRLDGRSRLAAARRLAVDGDDLASSIAEEFASVAGAEPPLEFRPVADRLVDDLVSSLLADSAGPNDGTSAPAEPWTADGDGGCEPEDRAPRADRGDAGAAAKDRGPNPSDDGADATGEYVARFFADRGSVGAVGGSSPETAAAHAASFLLERGLSGVRIPWPDDGDVVLNENPVLPDGTPMASHRELPNGLYLNTAGDVDVLAARVLSLAERAGLRAMLTGDWSGETD